jgi:glycosyltransferase involved in cell wall biosynthesis
MIDFIEIKDDIPNIIRLFLMWTFRWLEPSLAYLQNGLIFADDQIANEFKLIRRPKTTLFNFPIQSFLDTASLVSKNPEPQQPKVLYLGGLKRNRGTSLMLDAFRQVLDIVPKAQLFLVGPFAPEALEKEMRSEIEIRNMCGSVIITGPIPFEQVSVYLAQSYIGWIPFPPVAKYQKNIPTKLFEYMAYAIPVVSSDLYPVQQFIEHRKTGLLVKADNTSAHAMAIIELISDPSLAVFLGKNGQKAVMEHFRWSDMEKRLITLYQQILS